MRFISIFCLIFFITNNVIAEEYCANYYPPCEQIGCYIYDNDMPCANCHNKPLNSYYTGSGGDSNNCPWACDTGYHANGTPPTSCDVNQNFYKTNDGYSEGDQVTLLVLHIIMVLLRKIHMKEMDMILINGNVQVEMNRVMGI